MDMDEARALVARGAALLDAQAEAGVLPVNWRTYIETARLDIYDPWDCILGQLTRRGPEQSLIKGAACYSDAVHGVFDLDDAEEWGFVADIDGARSLTAAWREVLLQQPEIVS